MDFLAKIKEKILQGEEFYSVPGTVVAIDKKKRTCTVSPLNGEPDIPNCRLQASSGNAKGFCLYPVKDSFVLVTFISRNEAYVGLIDEIDEGSLIAAKGFTFNDGSNGGLCNTPELKNQLDKNNEILKAIINVFNGAPIAEPGNGLPSALQISLKSAVAAKTLGDFGKIEDKTIKH